MTIVDESNRRSGWEGHTLSGIPGCIVELVASEVAEPTHYVFRWDDEVAGTFRLSVRPRTDGEVSLAVRATAAVGTKCEKLATADLKADDEKSWRVRIEATKADCAADLVDADGE